MVVHCDLSLQFRPALPLDLWSLPGGKREKRFHLNNLSPQPVPYAAHTSSEMTSVLALSCCKNSVAVGRIG